ncbi:MAG: TolC family protein [Rikenellaceae bacterium]
MKISSLLVVLFPFSLFAQIDVDTYRRSVVEYSYTLKKSSAAIDYALETNAVKRTNYLPTVTLSGDFSQQFRNIEGQEEWNFSLQPQLSQTVYNGGGIRAEVRKTELGVTVAEMDAAYNLLDVCYNADYKFYNLQAMRSYRDAVAQYVDIVSSLKEVVQLRYSEGYISKSDLLMIETRLSEALYEQIALDEDYAIALHEFNILRGYEADALVLQDSVNVDAVELPSRSTIDELLMRRPDFIASELSVDQADCTIAITRSAYNPTVSVGVVGSWQPNTPNINGSTVMNGSLFVKLSAPLFHFSERKRAVNASRALRQSSEFSTLALIDDIRLEESSMWAKIVDSRAQLDAARHALEVGGENLEISTFSYSEGLTTILDVMQAQISWLQLYTNSIWSEFNYLLSISAYKRISATVDL